MDRRKFLTGQLAEEQTSSIVIPRTFSGLMPYSGVFGKNELTHLLKRTLFGVTQNDINLFKGKTLSEVIQTLLIAPPASSPPLNYYNDASSTDANVPTGQTWVTAPYGDGTINSRRVNSFKSWWTGRVLSQNASLYEKMVLFWHNHFATETGDISDARFIYKHHQVIRTFAFGNFRQFIKQITIDPSMLRYLNGYLNTKTAPDENYGRELQELFTLGKGPGSKYNEDDVKAASKVLTGYRIDANTISYSFDPTRHDTGNKTFSAFYNNKVITGKIGAAGATELDDMLDMIFLQSEVSMYICRRLYRFFVYYNIDSATEANVIAPLAEIFKNNNFEIKPVLQALFSSEHFFDVLNRGCLIKSPIDLLAGLSREFEVIFPDSTDGINQYYMWEYIRAQASILQQNLGDPPNVAGWPAYYQQPQFHELWINSDTLPKRIQFTDRMISTGYTRNGKKIIIDPIAYVNKLSKPDDPNLLIKDVLDQLYSSPVSQQLKDFLKSILLSGQSLDYYWTEAWQNHKNNPANVMARSIVNTRLVSFFKYVMNLSEYQLS
ncbi:MAG TPA: DUF1800 domain-containing protein [Sphingobacteriaceae bacterium]|nr:DUF1800 domain-containing protein [Sphingobacteriaceae bacterium]